MKKFLGLAVLALASGAAAQFEGKAVCFTLAMASDASGFGSGGLVSNELMDYSREQLRTRGVEVLDETFDACEASGAVPLALLIGHPPDTPDEGLVAIAGETYEAGGRVPADTTQEAFDALLNDLAELWLEQNTTN
jgi:hypothetical protein